MAVPFNIYCDRLITSFPILVALFKRVEAKIKTLAEDQSTMLDSEILDQVAEKVVEILKIAYQNPGILKRK